MRHGSSRLAVSQSNDEIERDVSIPAISVALDLADNGDGDENDAIIGDGDVVHNELE